MNFDEYLSLIIIKLKKNSNFNILNSIEEHGMKIDLYADTIFLSDYVVKNRALMFNKYEIHEKYYIKHYCNANSEDIKNFFSFLKLISNEHVPASSHIQNCITGVMLCDSMHEKCKSFIESLSYTKPYSMYFKGWSEIQLIFVDLNTDKVYCNGAARKNSELFISDAIPSADK